MIYKVSFVVTGTAHPGEIVNLDAPPSVGDQVKLGDDTLEVVEVIDLAPPRGDFAYLHVTCRPVQDAK